MSFSTKKSFSTARKFHYANKLLGGSEMLAGVGEDSILGLGGRSRLWSDPPHTNEMGCFVAMFDTHTYYDALFEVITVDAGMTCKAHAAYVQAADKGYVMAVKDSQPELLRELQLVLLPQTDAAPVAHSDWERSKGHSVQRRQYLSVELAGCKLNRTANSLLPSLAFGNLRSDMPGLPRFVDRPMCEVRM